MKKRIEKKKTIRPARRRRIAVDGKAAERGYGDEFDSYPLQDDERLLLKNDSERNAFISANSFKRPLINALTKKKK